MGKIEKALASKDRALAKVSEIKSSLPVRAGIQSGGTLLAAFTAGATDAAAASMGVPSPGGIRPSHVIGGIALLAAVAGFISGQPMVVDLAGPIAAGHLAPHLYGMGIGSIGKISQAINTPATPPV